MTAFVLVHGGWHGAWCWSFLVDELAVRGHSAVAVDLPAEDPDAGAAACAALVAAALVAAALPPQTPPSGGATSLLPQPEQRRTAAAPSLLRPAEQRRSRRDGVSDRADIDRADIDRTDADRADADQGDVVLVGHSLGGLTIPLVADDRRVRHLVYLAAMLPEIGGSVAAGERQTARGLGRGLVQHEDGSSSWDPAAAVARLYPDSPPERAAWAAARLRRQHWRAMDEVTPLTAWPDVPTTYVRCADDAVIDAGWAGRAVPDRLGVEPVVLPGDHSPFLSRPADLADLLAAL